MRRKAGGLGVRAPGAACNCGEPGRAQDGKNEAQAQTQLQPPWPRPGPAHSGAPGPAAHPQPAGQRHVPEVRKVEGSTPEPPALLLQRHPAAATDAQGIQEACKHRHTHAQICHTRSTHFWPTVCKHAVEHTRRPDLHTQCTDTCCFLTCIIHSCVKQPIESSLDYTEDKPDLFDTTTGRAQASLNQTMGVEARLGE